MYTLEDIGKHQTSKNNIGLVLGGSTAFGSFSTTDEFTLASLLSDDSIKYFTIAQPGDTLYSQAMKCVGIQNSLNIKCSEILAFVGFNEIFWGCTCPLLTPFGYVEKQKHYLFSDDILSYSFSNTIQGYNENWNSYMAKVGRTFLEGSVLSINPLYELVNGDISIDSENIEKCFMTIINHFTQSLKILSAFFPEASIKIVLQPSAISEKTLLSEIERECLRDWIRNRSSEQKQAFFTQVKYLKPLLYSDLCKYITDDIAEIIDLSSQDHETKDSLLSHECHLTDEIVQDVKILKSL